MNVKTLGAIAATLVVAAIMFFNININITGPKPAQAEPPKASCPALTPDIKAKLGNGPHICLDGKWVVGGPPTAAPPPGTTPKEEEPPADPDAPPLAEPPPAPPAPEPKAEEPPPCVPDCKETGKKCGDDGCGGTCGDCGEEETCSEGKCVPLADPCENLVFSSGNDLGCQLAADCNVRGWESPGAVRSFLNSMAKWKEAKRAKKLDKLNIEIMKAVRARVEKLYGLSKEDVEAMTPEQLLERISNPITGKEGIRIITMQLRLRSLILNVKKTCTGPTPCNDEVEGK